METFRGLPLHPLVVHAVVVLLPLATLCVAAHAVWPAARRRLGAVTPLLALLCVALVPIATTSGHRFAARLFGDRPPPLVLRHEQLAGRMLPWTIGLAVVAVGVWWSGRRPLPRWARFGMAAVALVVAAGTAYTVAQVGEAGARAAWG